MQFKLAAAAIALAALVPATPRHAAGQAPDEEWRTLRTEHFRVTFPEGMESVGRRAALHAESAYDALAEHFLEPPRSTIDLLVTDHTDESNGFAQLLPSNRITVFARPPVDGPSLSYFDDWLELVITHELAHVVHLDHTGTWLGRLARAVFGRADDDWPFFPGAGTPGWVIEGLATWYESSLTSAGRVRGTFHEMVLRTAALEGRFEDIGQAGGNSPLWPAGTRPYAYGSLFFDHLLAAHGQAGLTAFVEAVAGQWVPYRMDAAGREAFGVTLSEAWSAWADSLRAAYADLDHELERQGPVTEPERLTHGARWGFHPTVSPDGRTLVHVQADGRSDTQLRWRSVDPGTARAGGLRTNGLATFAWLPDGRLLVSQLEADGPYRTFADLWIMDLEGGSRRLTRGARLEQPSVSADGSRAVAVQQGGGSNALVEVDLGTGEVRELVPARPDVHWAFPRLSPDGRWIAATRWERGARHDVVLLEAERPDRIRRVTDDRALDLAPSWSPDGRWLVWASDRTGIANVLGARVDPSTGATEPPVLLTSVRTGAFYPSVDPSGRWLWFSGYHVDGWEVERIPFRPEGLGPAPAPAARFAAEAEPQGLPASASTLTVEEYSPLPTLWPRYWEPVIRDPIVVAAFEGDGVSLPRREIRAFGLGAETSGVDLVGRHAWGAYAHVFTTGGDVEAGGAYSYRGLGNPILSLTAEQTYAAGGHAIFPQTADTLFVLERLRRVDGSLLLRATRSRSELSVSLGGGLVWEHPELLTFDLERSPRSLADARLAELRVGAAWTTARSHAFQLGAARGLTVSAQLRSWRHLDLEGGATGVVGLDRSFDEVTGRVRGYLPLATSGRARHVLALQLAGGTASGPGSYRGHFGIGGAAGRPEGLTGFTLFGGDPLFLPVRGYEVGSRAGRHAWAGSAEYRFPLALINQGLGAWPLHLDRLWGSVFVDAGNAWDPGPLRRALVSAGAELTLALVGFYDSGLLLRGGFAAPLVGGADPGVYVRAGLSF